MARGVEGRKRRALAGSMARGRWQGTRQGCAQPMVFLSSSACRAADSRMSAIGQERAACTAGPHLLLLLLHPCWSIIMTLGPAAAHTCGRKQRPLERYRRGERNMELHAAADRRPGACMHGMGRRLRMSRQRAPNRWSRHVSPSNLHPAGLVRHRRLGTAMPAAAVITGGQRERQNIKGE